MPKADQSGSAADVFGAGCDGTDVHLRLLATSDLHMHIWPYDYFHDAPEQQGLVRAADHIARLRSEADNSLFFDNGDLLQGNPMGDLFAQHKTKLAENPHPIIAALNALGTDAATLGNHDFNYGLPFLKTVMAGASFPFVSANLNLACGTSAEKDTHLVPPFAILERTMTDCSGHRVDVNVGVIGFAPPQTTAWDRKHLDGVLWSRDIVEAALSLVPRLREAGADIVVALSHSGIGEAEAFEGMENASVPLAAVDGIDVLITGHTHLVFPSDDGVSAGPIDPRQGTLHGKPAVMPGSGGSHVGVIDLLLSRKDEACQVKATSVRVQRTADAVPASGLGDALRDITRPAHEATLAYIRQAVGQTTVPLHTYFSAISPAAPLQLIGKAQIWRARHVLAGTEFEDLPILAAAAPFKCGGRGGPTNFTDVDVGPVQQKHLWDIYPYPNELSCILVSGAELRDWLEYTAGYYRQIVPGVADQTLVDPMFPGHDADTIVGVSYQLDLSSPARFTADGHLRDASARRVVALSVNGQPIVDDMQFIVATNDYRASGDGSFPGAHDGRVVMQQPWRNKDILADYIREIGPVPAMPVPNWSFVPHRDTSVIFQTGPGARRFQQEIQQLGLRDLGPTEDGFVTFGLDL